MAKIKYRIIPWRPGIETEAVWDDVPLGFIYVKHEKNEDGQHTSNNHSRFTFTVLTPDQGRVKGSFSAKDLKIPELDWSEEYTNNQHANIQHIINRYKNNIHKYLAKKGYILSHHNRRWFPILIMSSIAALGAFSLGFYLAACYSLVVAEFLMTLATPALVMVTGSVLAIGVGLAFIMVGSYLLCKPKDCEDKTQVLEGSMVSACGFSGTGAALGALLGSFFPIVGTAIGAGIGAGVGFFIAAVLSGIAAVVHTYPNKWDRMINNNGDIPLESFSECSSDLSFGEKEPNPFLNDYKSPLSSGRNSFRIGKEGGSEGLFEESSESSAFLSNS